MEDIFVQCVLFFLVKIQNGHKKHHTKAVKISIFGPIRYIYRSNYIMFLVLLPLRLIICNQNMFTSVWHYTNGFNYDDETEIILLSSSLHGKMFL